MKNPRVKKAIIIASSVVVVLIVLTGLFLSFVSFSPALITYNEREEINDVLLELHGSKWDYSWYYSGGGNKNCRCYGRENGYILVFFVNFTTKLDYKYITNIDGVAFANTEYFSFYVYKDGKLVDIADAYEQGLISKDALLKAKEYHDQCQKDLHAKDKVIKS